MAVGLLNGRFFQMAYVTNDIDRAMAEYGAKAGIDRFFAGRDAEFDIGGGRMAKAHIALANVGGVQIELIEPVGGHDHVYRQVLSGGDYQIHFHHEAHVLDSVEEFAATKAHVGGLGFDIVIDAETPGYRYFYADTRTFIGHHTEFFYFSEEATAYFREVVPNY